MADIDGNPDTQEMYDHFNEVKQAAVKLMDEAHVLATFGDDFSVVAKAERVAAFTTAHPDCELCRTFAGNPPAPVEV